MRRGLVGFVLGVITALGTPAFADQNDLVMARLGTRITDGSGNVTGVVGDSAEFRSLASQLGTVLAPHLLTPADTIGFGGFQLTADYATTTIDGTADYWKVREGGSPVSSMRTVGFFMRKGMWFPIPSFELGAGAVHLVDSRIWTGQLYAKFALHEGYHQLPLPSLAVRGGVSRMLNQRELDLTTASIDVELSKHFGIGGTWRFDPFVGWNTLLIIPRSEVIDPTPNIDPLKMGNESDILLNFVFKDQANIIRNRIFLGAKFQYYVFQFTLEAQFALKGTSKDDRKGTNDPCMPGGTTAACDSTDTAAAQRTLSMSAGFDF
jgi:hypothetical protein